MGAILIGFMPGLCCYLVAVKLKNILKSADSLDVFGVHGIGGMVGASLAATAYEAHSSNFCGRRKRRPYS